MGGEDHFARDARHRDVEPDSLFLHARTNRFQHRKSAVPFVQVKNAWRDAHGFERAEASHAKHQLLPDSRSRVSAVEAGSQLPVVGSIVFHIRIEQEQVAASNLHPPDFGMN